ncbi:MAG TPA: VOC family protein, partial [Acidimicrobiales bacterium]|nr:VOC family protein [Acidimicrobiales bacterium]
MNVSSTIDVDVDPMTAFTVFTDELDQWWGNGPIDAWDSSRCIGRRLEPGVGGRLLEVYEGDALELGRVTVWEPGARVCWQSSVDDVVIEVYFEPAGNGTRVRVDGIVPDGKTADAGLSFVRMTPEWLPRWMERRPAPRPELSRLNVIVHYAKPVAAAHWLCGAFGFETTTSLPAEDSEAFTWIEMRIGNGAIMLYPAAGDAIGVTHQPFVYVNDVEAHFEDARAAGATIVEPIKHHGFKAYVAEDLEGRRWT